LELDQSAKYSTCGSGETNSHVPARGASVDSGSGEGERVGTGRIVRVGSGVGAAVGSAVGATVAVTAGSAEKLERCRALGASVLVNYKENDFVEAVRTATGGRGADVILDNMGASYLARNVEVLAVNGRLVVIGLQGGARAELDIGALLRKRAAVIATSLRARPLGEKAAIVAAVREHVWPLLESGEVRPVVHATMPLSDIAEAHEVLSRSQHVGKVLIEVT